MPAAVKSKIRHQVAGWQEARDATNPSEPDPLAVTRTRLQAFKQGPSPQQITRGLRRCAIEASNKDCVQYRASVHSQRSLRSSPASS
jgi:hypothetical protein